MLTGINYIGVVFGGAVQNVVTWIMIASIIILFFLLLFLGHGSFHNLSNGFAFPHSGGNIISAIGLALAGAFWAYDGWNNGTFIAGEVKNPQRNVPLSLLYGTAIVRKPKVFLFDEPLSNLDAKLRVQMRTEISKLHHSLQATMIYVTHDQTEAMTMGDKIVVMKDGIVNQLDSPLNVYNFPSNKFVAGFIGSPSMNFIEGKILSEGGLCFKSSKGNLNLNLGSSYDKRLNGYLNKVIWLGIRPEDIYDSSSTTKRPSFNEHEANLEVVEPMGNEIFLYFPVDGIQFTARIPAREKPQPGAKRLLYFDIDKLHFFDTESELAL